jgi:hypothetical protein
MDLAVEAKAAGWVQLAHENDDQILLGSIENAV